VIGLRRLYLPEPMPIIDEVDQNDVPDVLFGGHAFRKYMLILYVAVSFTITLTVCLWMSTPSTSQGHEFGQMSCSHDDSNQFMNITNPCK